jgi:hypothetical protein
LDQSRREFESTQVFMTVVQPNPAYMQTQALVTHEVATGVAADRPIAVYARVLRHDEEAGPYVLVRRMGH